MSDLLLNHNLGKSKPGDEVSQVAREGMLTTLRRLDANRIRIVLQFLGDANLIGVKNAVVDLSGVNLRDDDLRGVRLGWTDLSHAFLSGAVLSDAILSGAVLSRATLNNANLSHANLSHAIQAAPS
jgi:uncharacterized protein YjbI with pentapeptide repeats